MSKPRRSHSTVKFNMSMEKALAEDILALCKDVELSRSQVIADLVEYVLYNEKLLDQVYPPIVEEETEAGEGEGEAE